MYIALNPRWRVKIIGDRYTLFTHRTDNVWDMHTTIEGTRRVLLRRIDKLGIVPTRDAQQQLDSLPECSGFRADEETVSE